MLHGGSEAVWLDDVFERSAPGIQVVTAGQVARGKLLGAWCWLAGHREAPVSVLEGSPISDREFETRGTDPMAIRIGQSDGCSQAYILEPRPRMACRVCHAVQRDQVDRGAGMARLHPTAPPTTSQWPFERGALRGHWWRRLRPPWNPWRSSRGYLSVVSLIWFATFPPFLLVVGLTGRQLPGWVWLVLSVPLVGDVVVSNIVGPVRTFLEDCGARFDHHPPMGQRPGGQPVWRLASGQDTGALPGPTP